MQILKGSLRGGSIAAAPIEIRIGPAETGVPVGTEGVKEDGLGAATMSAADEALRDGGRGGGALRSASGANR